MQQATVTSPPRLVAFPTLPEIDAPRLCLGAFAIAFFAFSLLLPTDPDYWWHLRTGQLIVESRSVPQTDPFSFTAAGESWIAHEWLAEVIIYSIQSLGGYAANALLFSALALSALLVAQRTALSLGAGKWLAVFLFIWAGLMSVPYWVVRPQVFTWLFFAIFVAVCLNHRAGKGRLWVLPALMVAWANLHGGYVFGLGVLGLYLASLIVERLLGRENAGIKPAAVCLGACTLATLLTPNPVELLLYPLTYLKPGNASMELINEWQSPNFHSILFLPLSLSLITLLGLGVFSRQRYLFLPLLALALAYLALQSVRNQPLFAIVFLIAAGAILGERLRLPFLQRLGMANGQSHSLLNAAILCCLAIAAGFFLLDSGASQLRPEARTGGAIPYPEAGADFVTQYYPEARIFNEYGWGGYLIYRLHPQPVFIDGRADVYGDALMNSFVATTSLRRDWHSTFDDYGVNLAIIRDNTALSERLDEQSERWTRVFTGPAEAVFIRRD